VPPITMSCAVTPGAVCAPASAVTHVVAASATIVSSKASLPMTPSFVLIERRNEYGAIGDRFEDAIHYALVNSPRTRQAASTGAVHSLVGDLDGSVSTVRASRVRHGARASIPRRPRSSPPKCDCDKRRDGRATA
jgi:hypothetical protein